MEGGEAEEEGEAEEKAKEKAKRKAKGKAKGLLKAVAVTSNCKLENRHTIIMIVASCYSHKI